LVSGGSGADPSYGTLITASYGNSSVTLAKMADMATASFLGRNTAGTGVPEVLSAATAKAILGITAGVLFGPGPHILLEDRKASGTAGGTFTSGADRTRDLNTEVYDPNGWCSLSANQFTLVAGTYIIAWNAVAFLCDVHQSLLYNATDAAEVGRGTAEYSYSSAPISQSRSQGNLPVTIAGSKAFEIRHRCQTTAATNGMGAAGGLGTEIYTQVAITRVA
jgi:hypothetical protein